MPSMVQTSVGQTVVSAAPSTIANDGSESCTVTLTVRDASGNPIAGIAAAACVLAVSGSNNTVTQPTGVTNVNGEISGSFTSTTAEAKVASYTVAGLAMTDTASVAVEADGSLVAGSITATPGDTIVTVAENVAPSGGTAPYTRNLFRSTSGGSKGSELQAAVALPYDDEAVTNGTEYFYTLEVDDSAAATADTAQVGATPAAAGTGTSVFFDNFSTGNLSKTENGCAWTDSANASVQTGAAIPPGLDTFALRFLDPAGSPTWFEQRFEMTGGIEEPYFEWYQYFPDGTESPSLGPVYADQGSGNNKYFRVFGVNYSQVPEMGASTWANAYNQEFMENVGGTIFGMGEGVTEPPWGADTRVPDFYTAANRGRWVRIRLHCKMATAANNDGIYQMWVDDTLFFSQTTIPNYGNATSPIFYNGYLMGYANTGLAVGQRTFISRFRISTGGFV